MFAEPKGDGIITFEKNNAHLHTAISAHSPQSAVPNEIHGANQTTRPSITGVLRPVKHSVIKKESRNFSFT